jgi:two-component system response regulator RegX3
MGEKTRLLIVEDDIFLQDGLRDLLTRDGYEVLLAGSLNEARLGLAEGDPHLLILDVGLPDGNGFAFCQEIREQGYELPVLFLTARDEEYELVRGLNAGGDDYLCKPFRALELLSRIKALLRRAGSMYQLATREGLNYSRLQYSAGGQCVQLTPTEFALLEKFLHNRGQILTREQLLASIWDHEGQFIDDNTLSVHISRLRDKIGRESIETVRGIGYRWRGI